LHVNNYDDKIVFVSGSRERRLIEQRSPGCKVVIAEVAEWQTRYVQGVVSLRA
jgi:hypothetical protein